MLTCALLAVLALAAQAPATDEAALKTEVAKLVRQLDALQLSQRDAAEKALIELGPPILGLLPTQTRSAEAEQRIGRVRQVLQNAVAEGAAAPSLITLPAGKMRLSKVMAAFQEQTGNRIVDGRKQSGGPVPDPDIPIDFDKTPFWRALDSVSDQAGLTVYPFVQDAVQLLPRPEGQLPRLGRAAYSGPFRVEPVRITARRDLRTAANPAMLLSLEVSWEPRLKPIGLKQRMGDVQAVDDAGKPLTVDDPQAESEALLRRGAAAVELGIPLSFPGGQIKEIASLKGSLQAIIPGEIQTFRFTDLLKANNVPKRIAGATVTLERVRKNEDNLWEVYVKVQFDDAGKALESHRAWITLNEAYLEGPDGKPMAFDSSETTARSNNEVGMGYVFALDKPPEKLTFVYKTPGTIITKSFPYELKNILLP